MRVNTDLYRLMYREDLYIAAAQADCGLRGIAAAIAGQPVPKMSYWPTWREE